MIRLSAPAVFAAFFILLTSVTPQAAYAADLACSPEAQVIDLYVNVSNCADNLCTVTFDDETVSYYIGNVNCPLAITALTGSTFTVAANKAPTPGIYLFEGVLTTSKDLEVLDFDGTFSPVSAE